MPPEVAAPAPAPAPAPRLQAASAQLLLPAAGLVGLAVLLSIASPHFLTVGNLSTVLSRSAEPAITAIGMTWVMVAGGIDLSVGSIQGLVGVIAVAAMLHVAVSLPLLVVLATGLAAGLAAGLLNGALTVGLRVQPFIATLGTLGAYRGLALLLSNGVPVTGTPPRFEILAGNLYHVPVPLLFLAAVAAISSYTLRRTRLGRHAYAIGSNAEAARLSGIPVRRDLVWIYGIGGALAGLAAVITASRTISGTPTAGEGFELDVIAAVVIGGGSLSGGVGTVSGSIIGALLIEVLRNGCVLLNVGPYPQLVVIGLVVVAAVALDEWRRRRVPA